jgi:hypothetical protein
MTMGLQRRHAPLSTRADATQSAPQSRSAVEPMQSFVTVGEEEELGGTLGMAAAEYGAQGADSEEPPWASSPLEEILSPSLYGLALRLPTQLERAAVAAQATRIAALQTGVDVSGFDVHIDGALEASAAIELGLQDCEDLLHEEPFDSEFFADLESSLVHAISVGEVALDLVESIATLSNQRELREMAAVVEVVASHLWVRMVELSSLAQSGQALLEELSARFLANQAVYDQYRADTLKTATGAVITGLPVWLEAAEGVSTLVRLSLAFSRTQFDRSDPWGSVRALRAQGFVLAGPLAKQLAKGNPIRTLMGAMGPLTASIQLVIEQGVAAGHLALMQADVQQMERVREEFGPAMAFVDDAGPLLGPWMDGLQRFSLFSEAMDQRLADLQAKLATAPDASFYSFTN